jgi:hypothetical protein
MLDENRDIRETRSASIPDAELAARGLPEYCFTEHPVDHAIVILRRGKMGYWTAEHDPITGTTVSELNRALGITPAQEKAMLDGSMFGFHVPGADPKYHQK